jgi:hypothetical protein
MNPNKDVDYNLMISSLLNSEKFKNENFNLDDLKELLDSKNEIDKNLLKEKLEYDLSQKSNTNEEDIIELKNYLINGVEIILFSDYINKETISLIEVLEKNNGFKVLKNENYSEENFEILDKFNFEIPQLEFHHNLSSLKSNFENISKNLSKSKNKIFFIFSKTIDENTEICKSLISFVDYLYEFKLNSLIIFYQAINIDDTTVKENSFKEVNKVNDYILSQLYFNKILIQSFITSFENQVKLLNNFTLVNQIFSLRKIHGEDFKNYSKFHYSLLLKLYIKENDYLFSYIGNRYYIINEFNLFTCFHNINQLNDIDNIISLNDGNESYSGEFNIMGKNGHGLIINFNKIIVFGNWLNDEIINLYYWEKNDLTSSEIVHIHTNTKTNLKHLIYEIIYENIDVTNEIVTNLNKIENNNQNYNDVEIIRQQINKILEKNNEFENDSKLNLHSLTLAPMRVCFKGIFNNPYINNVMDDISSVDSFICDLFCDINGSEIFIQKNVKISLDRTNPYKLEVIF